MHLRLRQVLHLLPNEIALTSEARHLFCSIMPELIHYGYPLERLKRKGPNHDPPEPVSFVCYQPILSLIHLPGQGRERKWTADGGRVRFEDLTRWSELFYRVAFPLAA